jgi:hypothetical protein
MFVHIKSAELTFSGMLFCGCLFVVFQKTAFFPLLQTAPYDPYHVGPPRRFVRDSLRCSINIAHAGMEYSNPACSVSNEIALRLNRLERPLR